MALGGKAFCTMTGDVASVQAAVAAGRKVISDAGVLVNAVVISARTRTLSRGRLKPRTHRGKVGLFGIGLAAYWPQFKV